MKFSSRYIFFVLLGVLMLGFLNFRSFTRPKPIIIPETHEKYWLVLHRKSNREFLYWGVPGEVKKSKVIKEFVVKTGIPGERPTPLPQLVGRKYWKIIEKHAEPDNHETAPYFLTLDVPGIDQEPFGPVPYNECDGQCNWVREGPFGLHGTANTPEKLSEEDPGSSGCIRHNDEDITFLYELLDPTKGEIRYYIEDK